MEVTSTRTTKALLGTVLMDCIDRLAYRAYKAERRPVFICAAYSSSAHMICCSCGGRGGMKSCKPPK